MESRSYRLQEVLEPQPTTGIPRCPLVSQTWASLLPPLNTGQAYVPVANAVDGVSSLRCELKGEDQNRSLIYTFKATHRGLVADYRDRHIAYGFNIWEVRQDTG